MAPGIADIKEAITGALTENAKVASMSGNMKNYMDSNNRITTDYGVKQTNTDDSLRVASADKTGPVLLEDHAGREKISRFDHERIPERVVHARGAGAFGTFKLFESASDLSSFASLPSWEAEVVRIPSEMSVASLSSSTLRSPYLFNNSEVYSADQSTQR
jgi:hypothetical protein